MKTGKGTTQDEMVGWHQRLDGHEIEQAPENSEGQGSLACCSPWGRKESDKTNCTSANVLFMLCPSYLCTEEMLKKITFNLNSSYLSLILGCIWGSQENMKESEH